MNAPAHDENGFWILQIFSRDGPWTPIEEIRSNSLTELHNYAVNKCDQVETFFRLVPNDKILEEKIKGRMKAYDY